MFMFTSPVLLSIGVLKILFFWISTINFFLTHMLKNDRDLELGVFVTLINKWLWIKKITFNMVPMRLSVVELCVRRMSSRSRVINLLLSFSNNLLFADTARTLFGNGLFFYIIFQGPWKTRSPVSNMLLRCS